MTNEEKENNSERKSSESPTQKDWWDKANVFCKIFAAVLIAVFGFYGNRYLQQKQKLDNNIKLYTQLLSNKETSENSLRKDMFGQILQSFLKPSDSETQDTISRIREMRLSLELLARNFHESLDMKPLFKHLLMEIIRTRLKLKHFSKELASLNSLMWNQEEIHREDSGEDQIDKLRQKTIDKVKSISTEVAKMTNNNSIRIESEDVQCEEIEEKQNKIVQLCKCYDRELDMLIQTAKRVTRKQREVLEDVAGEIKLTVPFKGVPSNKICREYGPRDWLPKEVGTCGNKCGEKIEGISVTSKNLKFKNSDGEDDVTSTRYFLMKVRYAYPKWKQVYVEILTCPVKEGSGEMTESKCKENPNKDQANFWLEYFDFPLVDNTYLNSKQRYSVILEGFEADEAGEDVKAEITLLYYPASYAGLKEKSFYNNQLVQSLLKSELFREKYDR